MATGTQKFVIGGALVLVAAVGYRLAFAKPNVDNLNYEVAFQKLAGWKELPHSPNTLLLLQHPKSKALIRASTTQIVADFNPEPEVDTPEMVKRVVENAQQNQPEWKTDHIEKFNNGKVEFELFRKTNKNKTIIAAMAVKGNTTLLVSMSNTGEGGKSMAAGKYEPLLDFLKTIELQVSDKWVKIHEKYEDPAPETN